MLKKRYAVAAFLAAACMMFAGAGVGAANAEEAPNSPSSVTPPPVASSAKTADKSDGNTQGQADKSDGQKIVLDMHDNQRGHGNGCRQARRG
ncbi:hypothetical protein [Bifidobacterium bohemicum]|uniref:hypothetical protein n=1 Tax=Bifidobacterium bohemicum TaxID=638617 RepID=UPI000529ADFB|nr:hypothetical protein [Bifidobacterium bohemicum]